MHTAFCSLSGFGLSHLSWTLFTNAFVKPIFQWTRYAWTPVAACPRHLHGSFFHLLQVWLKRHLVRETFPNYPFKNVNIYSHPKLSPSLPYFINYLQMYYKMDFLCFVFSYRNVSSKRARAFHVFSSLICLEWGPAPNWFSIKNE